MPTFVPSSFKLEDQKTYATVGFRMLEVLAKVCSHWKELIEARPGMYSHFDV